MTEGAATGMLGDPRAHQILQAAHRRSYYFPRDFRGFSAKIRYTDGTLDMSGEVLVHGPRAVELDLPAPADVVSWTRQELASLIGHRWPVEYEASDGRHMLTLHDDGHPLGCLIRFADDPFASSYRVDDRRITQITRTMGSTRFVITIQEHAVTSDERLLPVHFTVVYWELMTNRLIRADAYSDQYAGIDGLYLPTLRRVTTATDSGVETRQMRITEHRLLAREH